MIERAPRASIFPLKAAIKSPALEYNEQISLIQKCLRYLRLCCDGCLSLHVTLGRGLCSEDCNGELSIVNATTSVCVVGFEEGTELLLRVVHAALLEHALELGEVD